MSNAEAIASKLTGTWICPGSAQFGIFIETGADSNEIIARDPSGAYWSEGTATVSEDGEITIAFNTGVVVTGQPSEDLNRINWDNRTVWYRQDHEEY